MAALEVRGNNMALLTQKQLEDIMSNVHVCDEDWFEDLLLKWNERQTTQQFEIDWSKAPRGAEEAVLELHWLDRNGDKFAWDMFGHFERNTGDKK